MRGYALVELMAAVSIMAALVAVIAISYRTFTERVDLQTTSQQIIGTLDGARERTLGSKSDSSYGVHFESDRYVEFTGTTYNASTSSNIVHELSGKFELTNITLAGAGADVVFDRITGNTANSGTVSVQLTGDSSSAVVALFVGRGFGLSREHYEQVRITEDARVQMERVSDAIRDARSLDFNGDGLGVGAGEIWLQNGEDYDILFYANVDKDDEIELVHYWLDGTNLMLGMTDPYDAGEEGVTIVAKSLRNFELARPLFEYIPVNDAGLIELVRITMIIDVDPNQVPTAAEVITTVAPRGASGFAGYPGDKDKSQPGQQ